MDDRKIKEHGKFHFQSARDVIQLNLLPIPSSNLLRKQKMHFTLQTYLLWEGTSYSRSINKDRIHNYSILGLVLYLELVYIVCNLLQLSSCGQNEYHRVGTKLNLLVPWLGAAQCTVLYCTVLYCTERRVCTHITVIGSL